MSVLSETDANAFNLISLGHTGVGKTVFLAGSYTELCLSPQTDAADQIWVECADSQTQVNLESLGYDSQTGQYPPATEGMTTFNFILRDPASDAHPLCRFRWQDVPGDRCQLTNLDFQATVLKSHGCFVFINAHAFESDPDYQQQLDSLFAQVAAIASLAAQHDLIYPLAIILTQCDRLEADRVNSLEMKLQAFLARLEASGAVYKSFSSAIPISQDCRWQPTGSAAPLLWLLSELTLHQTQPPQDLGDGLRKSLAKGQKLWKPEQRLSAAVQRYMSILALANVSLQALPVVENLAWEEPKLEWDFDLAYLYESRGQKERAEIVYNRILTQQENNLRALMAKAMLRHEQGDLRTARNLLQQALKAAPNRELKAKIYTIAQQTLGQDHCLTDNTDI